MPLLKFSLFAGASLLALLFVADHVVATSPTTGPSESTSLDVLRKMANHGEARGFAPLADAGTFLPMPAPTAQPIPSAPPIVTAVVPSVIEPTPAEKPAINASTNPSAALDAQARVADSEIVDRPARRHKKAAARKPKQPRTYYVENVPRGPFGFFDTQSW